jgi:cation diffusion facilitator CzcD-associated flavoprotein CzcO
VDFHDPKFAPLNKDPWIDHTAIAGEGPDLKDNDDIKFLVIGGGHAKLSFAYRTFDTGASGRDICVVDVAGGFGGTWYWNRYPGLMCDVEGYIYLPLLEKTGYMPKHRYSYGAEIRQQSERIA